jgi:NADH-quinone oxidoreductase subunit N
MTGMNDLLAIAPFVCAVAGAVVIALLDAISPPQGSRRFLGSVALVFLGLMALAAFSDFGRGPWGAFYGMVVADGVGRLFTVIFVSAAALAVLAAMGRLDDGADGNSIRGEFYALLLISTGGATLLGQAADLVVLFLALETLSIPAYVLAAGRRSDALSAEAGMKYFILGAVASGLLLYGIALLYGASGSTSFSQLARAVQERSWSENFLFIAGAVLVVAGLLFKLAAAPLHMWAPDVYQGSPTPATVFFSTGIKAAAFLALLRVLFQALEQLRVGEAGLEQAGWFTWLQGFAIATMTVANITALVQKDVKRLLAYSSVAHAGYLLVGLLCRHDGAAALAFYLLAYTFMTGGAFLLVAWLESEKGGTSLESYRGLSARHPALAAIFSVFLFSLAGIPPTAGFFSKFYLFRAAVGEGLVELTVIAVLNSLVSAYYYLRVMVAMYMEPCNETAEPAPFSTHLAVAVAFCLVLVLLLGIVPAPALHLVERSLGGVF